MGHRGWTLTNIYAEQTSGTRFDTREAFNRMMKDRRKGKADYIITKSISRFGRNTLPFMQGIEELLQRGMPAYFELERLDSSDWRMKKSSRLQPPSLKEKTSPKARISNGVSDAVFRKSTSN